ncbi:MAG: DNA-directed RNA polymerase subunit beta [Spirochaetia bacterium]|nr:DNA-directed RNA polymerase subunit beta [Spirochaetia bacterium]
MLDRKKAIKRHYIVGDKYYEGEYHEFMDVPNLIDIQLSSYEKFLQLEKLKKGEPLENQGLEEVFRSTFPIESPNGDMTLDYVGYSLGDKKNKKLDEFECKQKNATYSIPLKAKINLTFATGEIRQKEIYMGDIPMMTDRGTFIINGAERVIVSQIHRSPGVVFSYEKDKALYSSRIIPYRGSWLEFEIDKKKGLIFAKIDRKKRILGTIFLRALGIETSEQIIENFYATKKVTIHSKDERNVDLEGKILAKTIYHKDTLLYSVGDEISRSTLEEMKENGIKEVTIVDIDKKTQNTLHSDIILNCLKKEKEKSKDGSEPTKESALKEVFDVLFPGELFSKENGEKELRNMFFSPKKYDLGKVGRYKLNKKYSQKPGSKIDEDDDSKIDDTGETVLTMDDIISTMTFLIRVFIGEESPDDIDHLGNRRIRSVGELLTNQLKVAFARVEHIAKDRMQLKETETLRPSDLISIKPIVTIVREFFSSDQLSQFMDQVNPLAELTHKRRLSALGTGGLSRDRAGFEVRDVHFTHYGRMCPIETPEGANIGLIVSLANYTKVNDYGFLEAPYRKVENGRATKTVRYMDAMDEEKKVIAQANAVLDAKGNLVNEQVSVRRAGNYYSEDRDKVQYMDVSPKQVISVSTSLVPFIEHDDANRALMGSNMMRQAVPLLFPEAPIVGTGMEGRTAYDSGVVVKAKRSGKVSYVSSTRIDIIPDENPEEVDSYRLQKYQRTNQDTCFSQKPIVALDDKIEKGDVIADGPATDHGELALGRNVLVGFIPWNGYNYEDAILISERVVKEDIFTSIHLNEYEAEVRENKNGADKLTRDIPNVSEKKLEDLDEEGIIRIGAKVKANDILVGKVTPKADNESTPELKLLRTLFGEKAKDVKDTCRRVPAGVSGTVIDVQRLKKSEGDELSPGVEEIVKVIIATKRKLRAGDKLAGRHGNKGVVSRILPEEDMPYLADGTPLDICLNPLGVPSRMNLGQLMESSLGLAGLALNEKYAVPVFQSATNDMISKLLKKGGQPENSKAILYDGLTGEPFENPLMIGCAYMLKLNHLVDDKMHARSTGPYSLITQQPLGGKAQFGGQRLGEMEVWALEAYGAANTLQEFLTIKSDDMNGRTKTYENIVKGESTTQAGIPESFNVLVQELRGLALDMSLWNDKGEQIPLTEKDEELIKQPAGKQF